MTAEHAPTARSVTDLRKALVAETRSRYDRSKPYMDALAPGANGTQADWDAFTGLTEAGIYAWLIAGILRLLERDHPETAATVASWVEESLNSGMDWLENLNDDLDAPDDDAEATAKAGV